MRLVKAVPYGVRREIILAVLAGYLLMLSAAPAGAQTYFGDTDAITNQQYGNNLCATTGDLPVGVYSLVSAHSSFEPCHQGLALGQGAPDENCDSNYPPPSTWNIAGHGHLTFGPPAQGPPPRQSKCNIGTDKAFPLALEEELRLCAPTGV